MVTSRLSSRLVQACPPPCHLILVTVPWFFFGDYLGFKTPNSVARCVLFISNPFHSWKLLVVKTCSTSVGVLWPYTFHSFSDTSFCCLHSYMWLLSWSSWGVTSLICSQTLGISFPCALPYCPGTPSASNPNILQESRNRATWNINQSEDSLLL